jgi:GTPase SAR1 family protein
MSSVSPAYLFQAVTRRDGLLVCLQVWDTAGQERYHSVSRLFFRDADVAFVCCEAGSAGSADAVPDCEFVFVATKGDLLPDGAAGRVRANAERPFAPLQPRACHLTSALSRDGVNKLFGDTAEACVPRLRAKRLARDMQEPAPKTEPGGCC